MFRSAWEKKRRFNDVLKERGWVAGSNPESVSQSQLTWETASSPLLTMDHSIGVSRIVARARKRRASCLLLGQQKSVAWRGFSTLHVSKHRHRTCWVARQLGSWGTSNRSGDPYPIIVCFKTHKQMVLPAIQNLPPDQQARCGRWRI